MSRDSTTAFRAVAHRGAPRVARENTVPALLAALDLGADAVEIDVKLTADGCTVVVHDDTLDRLWGLPLVVRETRYDDLRAATPRSPDGIPDLADAVHAVTSRATLVIDVASTEIARACVRDVDVLSAWGAVAFTGDPEALAWVRSQGLDTELFFSWDEPGLPPEDLLAAARPEYLNLDARLVTADLVAAARERGMRTSCYTVNRAADCRALIRAGVDAIISDDVAMLRQVADEERAGDGAASES